MCMRSWDPDGAGPVSPLLIIGGSFNFAGGYSAERIVAFDGQSFSTLGAGMTGGQGPQVRCLGEFHGDLIAAGAFNFAGGLPVGGIARWDGTSWHQMGRFTEETPPSIAVVYAVQVHQGELYAAGHFTHADGQPAKNIARWDGTRWRALGLGLSGDVKSMCSFGGRLIAGDSLPGPGDGRYAGAWDGATWSPIGSAVNGGINDFAVYQGQLMASGGFQAVGSGLVRLSPSQTQWQSIGVDSPVGRLTPYGDSLAVVGPFGLVGGMEVRGVALWDGVSFRPTNYGITGGTGPEAGVEWAGSLCVGGFFAEADRQPSINWAMWAETPFLSQQPTPERICDRETAQFSVTASSPTSQTFQWQWMSAAHLSWTDVLAGENPGAGGPATFRAAGPTTATLTILPPTPAATFNPADFSAFSLRCVVSNACGSTVSTATALSICAADLDCDGLADFADFLEFLNLFDSGDQRADLNRDGLVDFADYLEYLNVYDAGC